MPLLQFDVTYDASADEKDAFADEVTRLYTDIMETTAEHVAVTLRDRSDADLHLGRAESGPILLLNADVREGRPVEKRREFALAVMDAANERWGVPEPNAKVVFTQHAGPEMMGYDRIGDDWDAAEEE
ncbi:tautomerase [Halorussus salinisoli]|uniref:tautomerase n=1 Tax=Halorussus salinisoli TaxID=2558242 RepID=UPI0010C17911|nr:tautomerase [Halorussus salinisoli]